MRCLRRSTPSTRRVTSHTAKRHSIEKRQYRTADTCDRRCLGARKVSYSSATSVESPLTTQFSSDYSEFVVDLTAPYGFALAPDLYGQIYIAKVEPSGAADREQIMVGDVLKRCTCALQPDEVCAYTDLRKVQWAIQKNKKRLRLVLKRPQAVGSLRWHRCGVAGCASSYSSWLLTPLHFPNTSCVEWSHRREGKTMIVTFHKTVIDEESSDEAARKVAIRNARAVELKSKLLDALQLPTLVLPKYSLVHPSSFSDDDDGETCYADILDNDPLLSLEPNRMEEQLNSKKLIPVLSWLQVTTGRLAQPDILELASQCALQCLLELRLHRCDRGVALAGVPCQRNDRVLGLIIAAATLHRLIIRRRVMLKETRRGCNILLHCEEEMTSAVGTLLAAYYYWYGRLDIDEAMALAEMALSATISKELIHEATDFLCQRAQERAESVTVLWPYSGNQVQVAGELVGGWDQRAQLSPAPPHFAPCFHVLPSVHYLRVKGLPPGTYHYKFIVDHRWAVDRRAPRDVDLSGNWNNVLTVKYPTASMFHPSDRAIGIMGVGMWGIVQISVG